MPAVEYGARRTVMSAAELCHVGGGGSSNGPLSRFYVLFGLAVRRAFPVAGEMSHKPPSVYQFSQDRKEGRKNLSAFFSFLSLISSTAQQF